MKKEKIINTVGYFILFIVCCIVISSTYFQKGNNSTNEEERVNKLDFYGEYQINGGKWKKLEKYHPLSINEKSVVKLRGHFNQNIPENENLIFKLSHLECQLKVDGKTVYQVKGRNEGGSMRTPGKIWAVVSAGEIKKSSKIEYTLKNVYSIGTGGSYYQFFGSFQYGSERGFLRKLIKENLFELLIGICVFGLGCGQFLIGGLLWIFDVKKGKEFQYLSAFEVISGFWILIKCEPVLFIFSDGNLLCILDVLCHCLVMTFSIQYAKCFCQGIQKKILELCKIVALVYLGIISMIQLLSKADFYDFMAVETTLNIIFVIIIMVCLIREALTQKGKSIYYLLIAAFPMFFGTMLELFTYQFGGVPAGLILSFTLSITVLIITIYYIMGLKKAGERELEMQQLKVEVEQSRTAVMLSQLQPHFIRNALTTIQVLCEKDVDMAKQALHHFNGFLKANFDSLQSRKPILFDQELEAIKNYIYLENLRFGERIKVEYDIQFRDFMIPSLTLQPLVETAIRYVITKQIQGGIVKISTWKEEDSIHIAVEDNGDGTRIGKLQDDKEIDQKLDDIRIRIEYQCHGQLVLQRRPEIGVKAEIILPL